jgi:translation initiation factor 1 (eIF-1/SUI1)
MWTTLNVVQENVIKGGLQGVAITTDERGRRQRRNVTTRQVNGIDQDVKLNRALWTLAEKMAELKSAAAAA